MFRFAAKGAMLKAYIQQTLHNVHVITLKTTDNDMEYYTDFVPTFASYLTQTTVDIWSEDTKKMNVDSSAELGFKVTANATADERVSLNSNGSQDQ